MRIAVIGLGKLGLCTAVCLAGAGYQVIGMDIQDAYIEKLVSGHLPFHEKGLDNYFQTHRTSLKFTSKMGEAIMESDVSFIIVPTPSTDSGAFSNRYIFEVLESASPFLKTKASYYVVNIVSTVMPGVCKEVLLPLLEKKTDKAVGKDIGLTYNPEFIAIGSVIRDFLHPDVVLIGQSDAQSGKIIEDIYRRTCKNEPHIARTSLINSEIAKLSINCFCTMKISFANNLSAICDRVQGADASSIAQIIGNDSRIGEKYIKPGLGFGGPCFPRDNEAFINFINQVDGYPGLQQAVIDINDGQINRTAEKILDAAPDSESVIALLGQTYKPQTYLTERSQALQVAQEIAQRNNSHCLRVFDPLARKEGPWRLSSSLEDCVSGANVTAILTPWPEFFDTGWHDKIAPSGKILNLWE